MAFVFDKNSNNANSQCYYYLLLIEIDIFKLDCSSLSSYSHICSENYIYCDTLIQYISNVTNLNTMSHSSHLWRRCKSRWIDIRKTAKISRSQGSSKGEDSQRFVCIRDSVSLRFGNLLYPGSRYSDSGGGIGDCTRGGRVRSEGDGIAKGITGGGERERDGRVAGGLIRGWRRRRRCWSWRRVVMALAVRDGSGRFTGRQGLWITHAGWRQPPALPGYQGIGRRRRHVAVVETIFGSLVQLIEGNETWWYQLDECEALEI